MAGVTGNGPRCLKALSVDGQHHFHHLPRFSFCVLIIFLKGVAHVAELAFDSQRGGHKLHGRNDLIGSDVLKHLQVLEGRRALVLLSQGLSQQPQTDGAEAHRKVQPLGAMQIFPSGTCRSVNHSVNWSPVRWIAILWSVKLVCISGMVYLGMWQLTQSLS